MSLLKPIENGRMYPGWHRWNPIGGCEHGCTYCSIKRIEKRSKTDMTTPVFRDGTNGTKNYLNDDLGSGRKIFVCSSGDMWGEWVKSDDIQRVLEHCRKYPENEYMFLTKNPRRYYPFLKSGGEFPKFSTLATTIETDIQPVVEPYTAYLTPSVGNRRDSMDMIRIGFPQVKTMVSVEPVMRFNISFGKFLEYALPHRVYIGADSGNNGLPEPSADELRELIAELETFTDVRLKKGLDRLLDG